MKPHFHRALSVIAALAFLSSSAALAQQKPAAPASKPQSHAAVIAHSTNDPRLSALDDAINSAISRDEIPGAVVLVGQRDRILYRKAYGSRSILPQREPMTLDTIFDLASLTKIFATTASVMKLFEAGKIRLNDDAVRYLPELGTEGATAEKNQITIRHLMTHTAGFPADPDDKKIPAGWSGVEPLLGEIYAEPLTSPPGARFLYSDSSFILLGEIVHRASGMPLNDFAQREVFIPLGMTHTRFLPPADWIPHIAPTEEIDLPEGAKAGSGRGRVLRGAVHDPRARQMGGVAGHAGLFSTADDLAKYCRMILRGGVADNGKRFFAAATVHKMTTPQQPPWVVSQRGLGWDIDSAYSAPRGELFSISSFGHTGFTGTSVWLDPQSGTYVILLANSVHPYGRPAISPLRAKVATIVAGALNLGNATQPTSQIERASGGAARPYSVDGSAAPGQTLTGLDVLESENFATLARKHIGLITNHTGADRTGKTTIDLLAHAPNLKLVALFSPEHGIRGEADEENVASATDTQTGLPVYSLYGDTRRPTDAMLQGIDTLVFDIQDAGVRFYTYLTTMAYCMEAAAQHHIAFYVLDRPDPIGGDAVEGPVLDKDKESFVGYFPMPVRIGMTAGEMAQMFNAENHIGADLHIVEMRNWRRTQYYEETGLPWISPSPNLRSLTSTVPYPGLEILQNGGVSVGRGTDAPFEIFGAPWINATDFADYMNHRYVAGVRFVAAHFTPTSALYKGQLCGGAALVITDRASLNSMLMGFEIAAALQKLYPQNFQLDKIITLMGNSAALARLKNGDAPTRILGDEDPALQAFLAIRAKYLLYR